MEITGKIIEVKPEESGTGKSGQWKKTTIVLELETNNAQYPKKLAVNCYNAQSEQAQGYLANNKIKASLNVESREYQGKWFTEAKAWKLEVSEGAQIKQSTETYDKQLPKIEGKTFIETQDSSDLPF